MIIEHWKFTSLIPDPIGEALDKHFAERGWVLERRVDDENIGYQVFFGAGVQVDNLYEYGFAHLYDVETTVAFAVEFYNQHICTNGQTQPMSALRAEGGAL